MGGDHFQPGETIEGALEDQMRQRNRGLGWKADGVGEPAVAGQPLVEFGQTLRMDEKGYAEFFGLGPYRVEFRIGEINAGHRAADRGALKALLLHSGLQFLHRQVRRLQGQRRKPREAVGFRGAEFGKFLVLGLHNLAGKLTVTAVPERIDREHFEVDGLGIHRREPLVELDESFRRAVDRRVLDRRRVGAKQGDGLVEHAMGMHVDGLDPLAADHHGKLLPRRLLGMCAMQHAATAEHDAGGDGSAAGFQEIAAAGHDGVLPDFYGPARCVPAGSIRAQRRAYRRAAARQTGGATIISCRIRPPRGSANRYRRAISSAAR